VFRGTRILRKSDANVGNALECTRRDSELVSACSGVHGRAMRAVVRDKVVLRAQREELTAVCVFRNYDATPIQCAFGQLAEQVAPHARYFVLQDGKWKVYRMANYQSITKKQKLYRGIVELFAHQWHTYSGERWTH
jgi:hypothetical protein